MTHIRPATESDASRIAEIIVTNYRVNFYPFFGELNVLDTAKEYSAGSAALKNTFVYDDGVIKGIIRISGNEVEKLYVEPLFQNQGIGAVLLGYAINNFAVNELWVLEYNKRGIDFYRRNGFSLTGEKITEDEFVPLLKMKRE